MCGMVCGVVWGMVWYGMIRSVRYDVRGMVFVYLEKFHNAAHVHLEELLLVAYQQPQADPKDDFHPLTKARGRETARRSRRKKVGKWWTHRIYIYIYIYMYI